MYGVYVGRELGQDRVQQMQRRRNKRSAESPCLLYYGTAGLRLYCGGACARCHVVWAGSGIPLQLTSIVLQPMQG
jgi:hypothetical protein